MTERGTSAQNGRRADASSSSWLAVTTGAEESHRVADSRRPAVPIVTGGRVMTTTGVCGGKQLMPRHLARCHEQSEDEETPPPGASSQQASAKLDSHSFLCNVALYARYLCGIVLCLSRLIPCSLLLRVQEAAFPERIGLLVTGMPYTLGKSRRKKSFWNRSRHTVGSSTACLTGFDRLN